MVLALFAACTSGGSTLEDPPTLPSETLTVTGLDGGSLSVRGLWLEETLTYASNGSTEVMHTFFVTDEPGDCAALQAAWDVDPNEQYQEAMESATPEEACALTAAYYADLAASPWRRPGSSFTVGLWNTHIDEGNIGVLPEDQEYTPLDGPDADVVEYAAYTERRFVNWWAEVAALYDCADPDAVWDQVSNEQEAVHSGYSHEGPIVFTAHSGGFDADLDVLMESDDASFEGGSLTGTVRFEHCPVERLIDSDVPVD